MSAANWFGRRIAELVSFFRGRQIVPCTMDWNSSYHYWNGYTPKPVVQAETCCGQCPNGCWASD